MNSLATAPLPSVTLSEAKYVFSANGARIHIPAWGSAPGIYSTPNLSAEGAIHSCLTRSGPLIRAFSAGSRLCLKSWGAAPGYREQRAVGAKQIRSELRGSSLRSE
jgi:hypothetical protein